MRARAATVALSAAWAACSWGSNRADFEARNARRLEPAPIEPNPTEGGQVGVARVRVYVDDDYRAQNRRHQEELRHLVARASQVILPTAGMALEVADIRPWDRKSGDSLQAAVEELAALDSSQEMDLIIGMVGALSRVEVQMHQLGIAHMLGRHMVLRGLNDSVEVASLDKALGTVAEVVRRDLYKHRRRHKELVLFLHEVGHTLGGLHVTEPRSFLHWSYDHEQFSFGAENAGLMRAGATAKMARGRNDGPLWRAMLDQVQKRSFEGWNEDDKAVLIAELEVRVQGGGSEKGAVGGEALGESLRSADRDRFRAAERLDAAGRPLDAWEELEPLIDFYPDEAGVQRLACRLSVATKRDRAAIESRCAHAARLGPGDAEPHLRLAEWHLAGGDRPKSLAEANEALALLERTAAEAGQAERTWFDLARHFQALGAVSWAEKAAGRTERAKEVLRWARETRVRFAIPPGGPVPPEREAEYVTALTELLGDVYARRFAEADRRAARVERSFGRSAGIHAVRCDLEVRRRRYPAARAHCRDAVRLYPESAWAHYLLGLLDKHDRKPEAALEHLTRAISLYPELKHAYQVAAELCGQLGRADDKKKLREKYRAQFSQDLP